MSMSSIITLMTRATWPDLFPVSLLPPIKTRPSLAGKASLLFSKWNEMKSTPMKILVFSFSPDFFRWHPSDFSFLSTSADKTSTLWALPPVWSSRWSSLKLCSAHAHHHCCCVFLAIFAKNFQIFLKEKYFNSSEKYFYSPEKYLNPNLIANNFTHMYLTH